MAGKGFKDNPELAREAGKKGGDVVRDKYGMDYFIAIGRKGGTTCKRLYGDDYFKVIGAKGGTAKGKKAKEVPGGKKETV